MMKKMLAMFALAGMILLPVTSYAGKIGFVNVTHLFNEYAVAKGIDKMIEEKFSGPKKDIDKLIQDIKALEKEIKTNELLMSQSKLESSKNKLKQMVAEYREKGMKLEQELKQVRNKEMTEFRKIVFDVTKEFATKNNYDLIVNEGVMYAADSINVTEEILKRVTSK